MEFYLDYQDLIDFLKSITLKFRTSKLSRNYSMARIFQFLNLFDDAKSQEKSRMYNCFQNCFNISVANAPIFLNKIVTKIPSS